MKNKSKPKKRSSGVLPIKSLLADLERFRRTCHEIVAGYLTKVESDITKIADLVATQPTGKQTPLDRVADLREC